PVDVQYPVVALGQTGEKPREPVIEAHLELGRLTLYQTRFAVGLLPVATSRATADVNADPALIAHAITGLGSHALALEEQRQPGDLVPLALVALEIKGGDGLRRLAATGAAVQQDGQRQGQPDGRSVHEKRLRGRAAASADPARKRPAHG